jgi:hypothetical protein
VWDADERSDVRVLPGLESGEAGEDAEGREREMIPELYLQSLAALFAPIAPHIGFLIALACSVIALYGVWLFNQCRDYSGARAVWQWSNVGFALYFVARSVGQMNGGLSDAMMAAYFGIMAWSNWRGMGRCKEGFAP